MVYDVKRPIVFVPGLFGSLGKDIIPGTGNMDFGLAKDAYAPLMNNLKALGYEVGKDLFVAFYDWRKENIVSAKKYLVPIINKAKEECKTRKVNLVCHSMGGIVARAYIQSNFYAYDVDKLIMIGTPNSGAVKSYYFWSGGVIPYKKIEHNFFFNMLKFGFLFYFKNKLKENWEINVLRRLFPVAKELLPSFDYGDYLMYRNKEGFLSNVPINCMEEKNTFLNELNIRKYDYFSKGIQVYQIIGNSIETEDMLFVNKVPNKSGKWCSGMPLYSITSFYGDGTVASKSVTSLYSYNYFIKGDHFEILDNSIEILSSILGRHITHYYVNKQKQLFCSIIGNNISSIEVNVKDKALKIDKSLNIGYKNDDSIFKWIKLDKGLYWLIIRKDKIISGTVSIKPLLDKKSNIVVIDGELSNVDKRNEQFNFLVDDLFTLRL